MDWVSHPRGPGSGLNAIVSSSPSLPPHPGLSRPLGSPQLAPSRLQSPHGPPLVSGCRAGGSALSVRGKLPLFSAPVALTVPPQTGCPGPFSALWSWFGLPSSWYLKHFFTVPPAAPASRPGTLTHPSSSSISRRSIHSAAHLGAVGALGYLGRSAGSARQGPTGVLRQPGLPLLTLHSGAPDPPPQSQQPVRPYLAAAPPPWRLCAPPGPGIVFTGRRQCTQGPHPHLAAALLLRSSRQAPGPPPAAPAPPRQRGGPARAPAAYRPPVLAAARHATRGRGSDRGGRPPAPSPAGWPKSTRNTLRSLGKGPAASWASSQPSTPARVRIGPEMARFFSNFMSAPPERGI
ncbi:hypothetical protein NDU88_002666 [Pleurodeles waltl]|uniref:Uncharacterized protein n=1 Tax=Pleurodeles waltl TaxID=8319 RepID=A0AAV7LGA7_PLEWA|nr:hypothetical protein NDU88_002666 [Pleurodeles waltl]